MECLVKRQGQNWQRNMKKLPFQNSWSLALIENGKEHKLRSIKFPIRQATKETEMQISSKIMKKLMGGGELKRNNKLDRAAVNDTGILGS